MSTQTLNISRASMILKKVSEIMSMSRFYSSFRVFIAHLISSSFFFSKLLQIQIKFALLSMEFQLRFKLFENYLFFALKIRNLPKSFSLPQKHSCILYRIVYNRFFYSKGIPNDIKNPQALVKCIQVIYDQISSVPMHGWHG